MADTTEGSSNARRPIGHRRPRRDAPAGRTRCDLSLGLRASSQVSTGLLVEETGKRQALWEALVTVTQIKPFDSRTFLAVVGDGRTIETYRKNSVVFGQGDPAESVFYIQRGKVKLSVISPRGKEAVIAILSGGFFFGEGCLAGQALRMATAVAITDSSIVQVKKTVMTQILHDEPEFSETFVTHLLTRNIRIEEDLVDQLFNSSEKRLARILLLLANFGKDGRPQEVIPNISQETLAEMIGTTRSRVSFFMNKFRKLGFIDYNGGMHVHTSLLNVILHD